MKITRLLPILVFAAACGSNEAQRLLKPGVVVPNLAAVTLAGDTVSVQSLRGNVVLLNMWATWCAPCRQETPYLQSIYERYHDQGFEVVGISMDNMGATDAIATFVEEYAVTYSVLHDPMQMGMRSYRAIGLPATFLIDRDGTLRWFLYGPILETNERFITAVEDALRLPQDLP